MPVSFATRLDKSAKLSGQRHPIVLQVTFDRKVRRKRLKLSATIDQWDFENHEFRKGVHGRRENNQKLEEAENKAQSIYNKHFEDKAFSYKKFVDLFSETKAEKRTVIQFCNDVSASFLQKGQANSSRDYKYLTNAIRKVSPKDLAFDEFTQEWLEEFEEYFTSRGTRCFAHMKHLKALFNKAVQKKLADFKNNPFKNPYTNPYGYEFGRLKKSRIARVNPNRIKDLSKEQIREVMNYTPRTDNEAKYLSLWFFSYYLFGVNLIDLALLQRSHLRGNRWFYSRSKTGSGLKRGKPILPEAMDILNKYDTGEKYVFDILNGYDCSPALIAKRVHHYSGYITKTCKRVSTQLAFDGYFTYYSARYTSATLALNMGADRNTVSHLLDHENFSTLDNYAGRADDQKVLMAMELLRV